MIQRASIKSKMELRKINEEESLPQEMTAKDLLSKKVFWIISLAFAFQFLSMMGVFLFCLYTQVRWD